MRKIKSRNGITLIALIITIIVLLILAVVAIGAVQNNGIINHAKNARDEYGKAQLNEGTTLSEYLSKIEANLPGNVGTGTSTGNGTGTENGSGTGSGNGPSNETENLKTESKAALIDKQGNDAKNKVLSTTENTTVVDEYGNEIVVPAGFMIRVDESTTYADHATEGIVIEDCTENSTAGSQFVWVPVGDVYTTTDETKTEENTKTIELSRYTFASDDRTPMPQGDAVIDTYFQELATSKYGNVTAKDLQGFINGATTKGGYYIGRYEAGDAVTTSARNSQTSDTNTMICKKGQYVYNYVTQTQASNLSRSMYSSSKFTSDLVNSYAWDTAIVFIQTFSGCSDYAGKGFINNWGITGKLTDKYCNIYDMASSVAEYSTEAYCNSSYYRVVVRGPFDCPDISRVTLSAQGRNYNENYEGRTYQMLGFRPLLYL